MTEDPLQRMTLEELWQLFPIILAEHRLEYALWYEEEAQALTALLGEACIRRISHIGSTAVPGLLTKPTVDILLEVDPKDERPLLVEKLTGEGWRLMDEGEQPYFKLVFNKGYTPQGFAEKVFHLHVREYGDWDELYFRDYLRAHPAAAQEYAALKKTLQPQYEHDRDGYTAAKTAFVQAGSRLARQEFPGRYHPQKYDAERGTLTMREQALAVLKEYNESEALIRHGMAVEAIMRYFAAEAGEDVEYWGAVGLLHDVDYEKYPEEHCKKAPELLRAAGYDDDFIHAVVCHGYGLVTDVAPEKYMEKVLYTVDEMSGLINAAALMRPSRSVMDMEVKSVRKKFKDNHFAAGVNRDVIKNGCDMLGIELDTLIDKCIQGMRANHEELGL